MLKRKTFSFIIIALTAIYILAGCASKSTSLADNKITVAVSIVPQETFVNAVAGNLVNVVTMIPPGRSPENYAPTPRQMESFSEASLFFSMGVPSEEAHILPKTADFNKELKIIPMADIIGKTYPHRYFEEDNRDEDAHKNIVVEDKDEYKHKDEHHHQGRDPHLWLSPKRVKIMVDIIAHELSAIDIANKSTYQENADEYKKQLDQLDEEIKASLKNLEKKTFIVYHPAFGYFADDYGLEMITLEEEGKEATAKSRQKKIDIARQQGIKVIFYQAEVDSKQSKSFAEELGGKAELLEPLASDYIENLRKTAKTFAAILNKE